MMPIELDVIFAVTLLSVTFNSVISLILFQLSKNSKSEIKLNYTAFFIAVFVLRNFMLYLFGSSKNELFFFFAESLTLFSSYLIIASVLPILSKYISAKWIYSILITFYVTFVSLLVSGVDFFGFQHLLRCLMQLYFFHLESLHLI